MIFTQPNFCRSITCGLGLIALLLFSACGAVNHTPDISSTPILDMSGDAPDMRVFESLSKGEELREPVIVKVPKGFALPVHIAVNTPLAVMESNCSKLVFQQDLFLYISKQGMLASPDTERWADIADIDAAKDLFGGDKGQIAISMGTGKDKGAQMDFKVIVYPHEQ